MGAESRKTVEVTTEKTEKSVILRGFPCVTWIKHVLARIWQLTGT